MNYASKQFIEGKLNKDPLNQTYNSQLITWLSLCKTQAMFKYKGLPDTINPTQLEFLLQCVGFGVGIIHEDKPYVVEGTIGGLPNQNNYPTKAIVTNPYLNINKEYTINEDCVIIKSDSLMIGLLPIIQKYSYLQARSELTLKMKDIMSRTPFMVSAMTDTAKDSASLFFKHLEDGDLYIVKDQKIMAGDDLSVFPTTDTGRSLTEAIEYNQYIKGCFAHDIGLNANYNMKREYVSNGETGLNLDCLKPFVDDMRDNRQESFDRFSKMTGLNISVEFNSAWEGNVNNGNSKLNNAVENTVE